MKIGVLEESVSDTHGYIALLLLIPRAHGSLCLSIDRVFMRGKFLIGDFVLFCIWRTYISSAPASLCSRGAHSVCLRTVSGPSLLTTTFFILYSQHFQNTFN